MIKIFITDLKVIFLSIKYSIILITFLITSSCSNLNKNNNYTEQNPETYQVSPYEMLGVVSPGSSEYAFYMYKTEDKRSAKTGMHSWALIALIACIPIYVIFLL